MRGQISTEMIIILAILLAVIVLVATNIQKIVKQNVGAAEESGQNLSGTISEISGINCYSSGVTCSVGSDCCSNSCVSGHCQ